MITVDEFLNKIVGTNFAEPFNKIENRDKKILISLNKQLLDGVFFTEKQASLLLKILLSFKNNLTPSQSVLVESPKWSKQFRMLEILRNIKLSSDKTRFIVEYSYDKDLKKQINGLLLDLRGRYEAMSSTVVTVDLNEKNLLLFVDKLKNQNFTIDQELLEIYDQLHELQIKKDEIFDSYVNYNSYFQEKLFTEIKNIDQNLDIKILDRRIRYQYKFESTFSDSSMSFQIANRKGTNVFVNSKNIELKKILDTLTDLERLPVLLILDSREVENCIEKLQTIIDCSISGSKGVYFRFDNNTDKNKEFNSLIQKYSLNSYLDKDTSIAVISNNTLPKFFLKSSWRPKAVISFTNSFRNNKSHVFCNDVDLKIYYNENAPMIGDLHEIV